MQTARSSQSSTSTSNSRTDKTDLELIVNNNPNYVAPKTRPGTTRHQLLQDLGHVELSNIVTGDGIMERNMRSAELETARKKDYQRDLMQQIEEKRRSIELLREKERRQEEALTRFVLTYTKQISLVIFTYLFAIDAWRHSSRQYNLRSSSRSSDNAPKRLIHAKIRRN